MTINEAKSIVSKKGYKIEEGRDSRMSRGQYLKTLLERAIAAWDKVANDYFSDNGKIEDASEEFKRIKDEYFSMYLTI
jgi:hypothetical protein